MCSFVAFRLAVATPLDEAVAKVCVARCEMVANLSVHVQAVLREEDQRATVAE